MNEHIHCNGSLIVHSMNRNWWDWHWSLCVSLKLSHFSTLTLTGTQFSVGMSVCNSTPSRPQRLLSCVCSSKSYFPNKFGYVTWTNVSFLFFFLCLSFINCLHCRNMICWSRSFTSYSNADGIDFADISGFDIFRLALNLYSKYTPLMVFGQTLYQFRKTWTLNISYGLNWDVSSFEQAHTHFEFDFNTQILINDNFLVLFVCSQNWNESSFQKTFDSNYRQLPLFRNIENRSTNETISY